MKPSRQAAILIRSALIALWLLPCRVSAQTDSSMHLLDSTVVAARRHTSAISTGATLKADIGGLSRLPSLLGNNDPVRFVRLLPSVQTGSDVDAGIHIQGCDNGHNMVSMDGVPVYGATHILGLFSVFNPSHFSTMSYSTVAQGLGRLGGSIDMVPAIDTARRFGGDFSVGLVSASGTLKAPLGRKAAVAFSARRSFLNLLYRPFLKIDKDPFRYGFDDFNLSFRYAPGERDEIRAQAYYGSDDVLYSSPANDLYLGLRWWNGLGSVKWIHSAGRLTLTQDLYATLFGLDVDLSHSYLKGKIPSFIRTYGYKAGVSIPYFDFSASIAFHHALPQAVNVTSSDMLLAPVQKEQKALEGSLGASAELPAGQYFTFKAGALGQWYLSPEKRSFWYISPYGSIAANLYRGGKVVLSGGAASQMLFQTGITNLGFPMEFWFLAGDYSEPQRSVYGSLAYNLALPRAGLDLSAELYYRRLYHQVEYGGNLLDFLSTAYSLESMILKGDGWNYGLNLMLHKNSGRLTGWASYSLGRSLRRFEGSDEVFPSNHERIHEFNLAATWSQKRWDAGAVFTAASGTPFTAPEAIYLTGGQFICTFGPHNAARVRPYTRLDVSFRWYFRNDGRVRHGIGMSIYNVYAARNDISYRLMTGDEIPEDYRVDSEPTYSYRPYYFALRIMPSINWFYKF